MDNAYKKEQEIYIIGIMKKKSITIEEEQEEWIQTHHLNLSRFVQDKLDELIENNENREDGLETDEYV